MYDMYETETKLNFALQKLEKLKKNSAFNLLYNI